MHAVRSALLWMLLTASVASAQTVVIQDATNATRKAGVTAAGNLQVDPSGGGTTPVSGAVYQLGTWTVQPGNTQNTTPWLFVISGATGNQAQVDSGFRLMVSGPVYQQGTWTVQPGNTANTTPWQVSGPVTQNTSNWTVNLNQVAGAATAQSNPLYAKERQATTGAVITDVAISTGVYQIVAADTTRLSLICTNASTTDGIRFGLGATPVSNAGVLLRQTASISITGTYAVSVIRDTSATANPTLTCSRENN